MIAETGITTLRHANSTSGDAAHIALRRSAKRGTIQKEGTTVPKPSTSFRISDEARYLLERLSEAMTISQTAVIQVALRRFAREEDVQIPTAEMLDEWRRKKMEETKE